MQIDPTQQLSRVDAVVEQIYDLIQAGNLQAGDRLPSELELANRFQLSRSVVREGISRLHSIGLLTVTRGRNGGTFIADQNAVMNYAKVVQSAISLCGKDLISFAEFRSALELFSARRAAELATPDDLVELQAYCDIAASTTDREKIIEADFWFHRKLATIGGNEVILHTLEVSREFLKAMILDSGPHDPVRNQTQHQAILAAIELGDPVAAEEAMRQHMASVIDCLLINIS